jgi:hypothetical protein
MKKITIILIAVFLGCCLFIAPSYAQNPNKDIELVIKSTECLEGDKISIKYGVINYRDFDRPNVSILFKIMEDKKPVACKEVKAIIPKGDDGSDEYEATIDLSCKGRSLNVESTIMHSVSRYKIEKYLSGCPGYKK